MKHHHSSEKTCDFVFWRGEGVITDGGRETIEERI